MAKRKKAIKKEYSAIHVSGGVSSGLFGDEGKPKVSISITEMFYDYAHATQSFTIDEANKIISLIEEAIKDAKAQAKAQKKNKGRGR
jgi:hypothetical protein